MTTREIASALLLAVFLLSPAVPARADPIALDGWGPFVFRPGDVLRATFDLRWVVPPPSLDTYDVLLFTPGVSAIEPIGSYTARLYDRGRLLGQYTSTGASAAEIGFGSRFIAPGSTYARGNPTVVDFTTFHDGTFDGAVEFEIHSGLAHIYRVSDELDLQGTAIGSGMGFAPRTFEIIAEPVPEPASLLLFGTGFAGLALRWRSRRR